MTVLIVLLVFAGFIALDLGVQYVRQRRAQRDAEGARNAAPNLSSGEHRPPAGAYIHGRHTWARVLDPVTVAIGIDDLAARLIGRASGLVLPVPGTRLHSDARGFRVRWDGRVADLVAPVDGTVVEINAALDAEPGLAITAPYDRGWLCKVRVADAESSVARLMHGDAAQRFLQKERLKLMERVDMQCGSRLAADGGEPVHDMGAHLDRDIWEILVRDFLAAGSRRRDEGGGR